MKQQTEYNNDRAKRKVLAGYVRFARVQWDLAPVAQWLYWLAGIADYLISMQKLSSRRLLENQPLGCGILTFVGGDPAGHKGMYEVHKQTEQFETRMFVGGYLP